MLCLTRCAQLDITTHCLSRVFKSQGLKILVHKGLKIASTYGATMIKPCARSNLPSTYMPITWHSARQAQLFQTNKERRLLQASKSVYTVAYNLKPAKVTRNCDQKRNCDQSEICNPLVIPMDSLSRNSFTIPSTLRHFFIYSYKKISSRASP